MPKRTSKTGGELFIEIRAYDAVQFAGAMELNQARVAAALSPIILVSADLELNSAARAEGLVVEDPNLHP